MKRAFLLCGLIFVAMYVGAQATLVQPKSNGVTRMSWSTDDNPARKVQMSLFHQMYSQDAVYIDPALGGDPSKLIVQCATGTGPDIVEVSGVQQMRALVNAGILLDLTPYASAMGFDPSKTYPALKDGLEVDSKQYRFPRNVWANCIVYNKQVFADHGVPLPKPGWTYDDFVRTCKLLQTRPSKSGQSHIPIGFNSDTGFYEDLLIGHGGRLFAPDGLHSALDAPPAQAAMQQYYNLMYVDKVIPTPADASSVSTQGGWGTSAMSWFSDGRSAMIPIGRWYIIQLPNFPNLQGNLGAVQLPRVGSRPSAGVADAGAAGVNVKSHHWRAALSFLQFLASPQYGKVIVEDGDSLPPNPAVAASGKALQDDLVPDPAFHDPFVRAMQNARPLDTSPYMDSMEAARWLDETVQKVDNRLLPPREALRELAAQVNRQIRLNLERQPALQKLYEQRTGRAYRPDW